MQRTLLATGLACVIAAIIGGGLKAFGLEVPQFSSIRRQLLLGTLGVALILVSLAPSAVLTARQHSNSATMQAPQGREPRSVPDAPQTEAEGSSATEITVEYPSPAVDQNGVLVETIGFLTPEPPPDDIIPILNRGESTPLSEDVGPITNTSNRPINSFTVSMYRTRRLSEAEERMYQLGRFEVSGFTAEPGGKAFLLTINIRDRAITLRATDVKSRRPLPIARK